VTLSIVQAEPLPARWRSAEDRRDAAQSYYVAAAAAGETVTGDDLGARYGMSARWGRTQIAAVEAAAAADPEPEAPRRPWYAVVVTAAVALLAAAASYGHMLELARVAGEPDWIARGLPLTVDGLVLASVLSRGRGRWWLAFGLAVSMAGNVAAADPSPISYLVAGWPPLALFGTHRLLYG
jgi:Protein of unknown function (DUF2637)